MKKFIYSFLIIATVLAACDSFLEEAPRELIDPDRFYVNEADGIAAITGVYFHLMHSHAFQGDYIDDYFGLTNDLTTPARVLGPRISPHYTQDDPAILRTA